uniref:phosphoethanolamine transferase n=1 Tax=Helicobacter bizzozeronii TaxID=56877 RepID=UPI000CEE8B3D|nr:phosphoethanolamine transferase [Helicobacter bizzozeronii]
MFRDVISAQAGTYATFETLLNYGDLENKQIPWYEQKNLGDIFKHAHYKSFWLDNQNQSRTTNAYDMMPRRFEYIFLTPSWSAGDLILLDIFNKQVRPQLGAKNAIVFHLLGSHVSYSDRFPPSYAKFHIKDIPYQGLHVQNDKDKQIIADYVNSIYYTDHILKEIFDLFKDKDAIIFYISDHAQDNFESTTTYAHRCSAYGVEIPFVIYVTDTFKQKHPEKVKAIAGALNKPFMADDLIHSLLPLVGIHTKDNLESKNLFSPQFDTKRKRIYCDNKIYKRN